VDEFFRVERVKQLCGEAHRFGLEYEGKFGKPAALRMYSAKYGKAFRSAGTTLREGLASDPRFSVVMEGKFGGYIVRLVEPLRQEVLMNMLERKEQTITELQSSFRGRGINAFRFADVIQDLTLEGRIVRTGDVLRLVE
jgi:hypothetical protein